MALTVVAAYDVAADDRRARLAAVLQRVGDRVQRSVFVFTGSEQEVTEVVDQARRILDPRTDSFYVFSQCQACWEGLRCVGQAQPPAAEFFWAAW